MEYQAHTFTGDDHDLVLLAINILKAQPMEGLTRWPELRTLAVMIDAGGKELDRQHKA